VTIADVRTYLSGIVAELIKQWPDNRTVNIVCHGHSVPAGYFATPVVDTFNAYPHFLHRGLKERFPFAVINVIVTAIGGENSQSGAERFERDVLCHNPEVITIDYGLNDRSIGLEKAGSCWRSMIEKALERRAEVLLMTPTADMSCIRDEIAEQWDLLKMHANQICSLADEYAVGLADSLAAFEKYTQTAGDVTDLLSLANHPNRRGHEIVAGELLRWFPVA